MKNPWIRAGVAIAAVGTLGIATAGPAMAEDEEKYNYGGLFGAGDGYTLNTTEGELVANTTGIYPEEDEAGKARTYRLDTVAVPDDNELVYDKHAWADTNIGGLAKANWIATNSYPNLSIADVIENTGEDLADVDDPEAVAYTATQAAIWAVTNNVKLDETDPTDQDEAVDAAVLTIATYYIDNAKDEAEPSDEFTIEGKANWDGKRIGPFHFSGVDDEGWVMSLKSDGSDEIGKIVDEDGNKIKHSHLEPGQKFYVELKSNVKDLRLAGIAKDSPKVGTLMQARYDKGQPTLMLAQDAGYGVTTSRDLTLGTPGGDDILPVTGTSLTTVMAIGATLLVGGALTLTVMRRRTSSASAQV